MATDTASDILEDALGYPTSDEDWAVTVLIGGLVGIASILVLPIFLFQGYLVAVVRETLAGEDLPEWGDVGVETLFVDGLKLTVVGVAYTAILIVPLALLFGLGILGGSAAGDSGGAVVGVFFALVALVYFVGAFALSYVLPAAIVNFARRGSVGAAFDFETIRAVATSREYLVGWLLALGINVLASIVMNVLALVLVGIVLIPWLYFFFAVAYFHVFARAYAGALDLDIPLSDVAAAEA